MLDMWHPGVLMLAEHLDVVLYWTRSILIQALFSVVTACAYLTRTQPVGTAAYVTLFVRSLLSSSILVQLPFHCENCQL